MSEEDLFHTLMRFHREIALPDMQRLIDNQTAVMDRRFDQVYTHFDGIYARFDRLESEYEALKAGLARVEETLALIENRLTLVESELKLVKTGLVRFEMRISAMEKDSEQKAATQSEILELKQQIAALNSRVADLEAR